jgi:hypothetical protein
LQPVASLRLLLSRRTNKFTHHSLFSHSIDHINRACEHWLEGLTFKLKTLGHLMFHVSRVRGAEAYAYLLPTGLGQNACMAYVFLRSVKARRNEGGGQGCDDTSRLRFGSASSALGVELWGENYLRRSYMAMTVSHHRYLAEALHGNSPILLSRVKHNNL